MIDDKTKKMFDKQCDVGHMADNIDYQKLNEQLTDNAKMYVHDITILIAIRQLLTPSVLEMINVTNDADIEQMLRNAIEQCMADMNEI